jgi:hypothetical protein
MRWEFINTNSTNEVYHLYKDDKKILTLVLNPFSNSARVECENEKRVFLIRKEGFLRNKTVIRNEYGYKMGELGHEHQENYININDDKFFYKTQDKPEAELVLYKDSIENPFVSCTMSSNDGDKSVHFTKDNNLSKTSHPGLLMALCWYMFLPVTKKIIPELSR